MLGPVIQKFVPTVICMLLVMRDITCFECRFSQGTRETYTDLYEGAMHSLLWHKDHGQEILCQALTSLMSNRYELTFVPYRLIASRMDALIASLSLVLPVMRLRAHISSYT